MDGWVWSNGGMVPRAKNQRTGRRDSPSVTIFHKFHTEWRVSNLDLQGEIPATNCLSHGTTLNIAISLQHDTLPLQFCGSNWPSSCKLPVMDPPPALYHFTIYHHTIPSSWKKEAIFWSTMWGSTQNHTLCQKLENFQMSQSSQYHSTFQEGNVAWNSGTVCPGSRISWFSPVPPSDCWNGTTNMGTAASFQVSSNVLLANHLLIWLSNLLTISINLQWCLGLNYSHCARRRNIFSSIHSHTLKCTRGQHWKVKQTTTH